jgi:hypothetical protein
MNKDNFKRLAVAMPSRADGLSLPDRPAFARYRSTNTRCQETDPRCRESVSRFLCETVACRNRRQIAFWSSFSRRVMAKPILNAAAVYRLRKSDIRFLSRGPTAL